MDPANLAVIEAMVRRMLRTALLAMSIGVSIGPSPLPARELPRPYDANAQVNLWRSLLESAPDRYELIIADLFESDSAPYAPRANSTMLSDVQLLFRVPDAGAFREEAALIQSQSERGFQFERSLFVHTSFELPGQQNYFLRASRPVVLRGQITRLGLWVHSNMYAHRLALVFRSAAGKEVQCDAGSLLFRGWRRLDLNPPPELYAESRLMERPYDHLFLGFLIESSPHAEAGDLALMFDNLTAISDMQRLRYPGAEYIDGWPQTGRGSRR